MNNHEKHSEDLLRSYIRPERIEKAPAGFTSKVMSQIQKQVVPLRSGTKMRSGSLVPYFSALVIILLIAAGFLIPGGKSETISNPALEILKNIKVTIPDFDLISLLKIDFPVTMAYVFIGILILTFFDRALHRIFHSEGRNT